MFTFTIKKGEIVPIEGVPDIVFQADDYEKFMCAKDIFEEQFPDKIFSCVDSVDATYRLHGDAVMERSVEMTEVNDVKVVYYGICSKQ